MSEYTPTTEQIRDSYRSHDTLQAAAAGFSWEQRAEEFDRWLAEHDKQVRTEERDRCWRIAYMVHYAAECGTDGPLGPGMQARSNAGCEIASAIRAEGPTS